jgi:hypothetical protein
MTDRGGTTVRFPSLGRPLTSFARTQKTQEGRSSLVPYAPEPIQVAVRDGKPLAIVLRKRSGRVREIINMWRIDEEWWRKPISRLYFLVELENGARITLFQDMIGGQWYRQNWT